MSRQSISDHQSWCQHAELHQLWWQPCRVTKSSHLPHACTTRHQSSETGTCLSLRWAESPLRAHERVPSTEMAGMGKARRSLKITEISRPDRAHLATLSNMALLWPLAHFALQYTNPKRSPAEHSSPHDRRDSACLAPRLDRAGSAWLWHPGRQLLYSPGLTVLALKVHTLTVGFL